MACTDTFKKKNYVSPPNLYPGKIWICILVTK